MKRLLLPAMGLLALAAGAALADELKSGLQVGEFTSPYDVLDVTGPNAGSNLCYR
jgi:hypothetical protein